MAANLYMHYVFDLWAQRWRRTAAHGDVVIVRYLDDFIVGFQHRGDAEREVSSGLAPVRRGDYQLAVSEIFGGNAFLPVLFQVSGFRLQGAYKTDSVTLARIAA